MTLLGTVERETANTVPLRSLQTNTKFQRFRPVQSDSNTHTHTHTHKPIPVLIHVARM